MSPNNVNPMTQDVNRLARLDSPREPEKAPSWG